MAAAGFGAICLIERPTKPWGERTIERVAVGERQLGIWGGLFVIGHFRRLSGLAWARLSFAERMFYHKYSGCGADLKGGSGTWRTKCFDRLSTNADELPVISPRPGFLTPLSIRRSYRERAGGRS